MIASPDSTRDAGERLGALEVGHRDALAGLEPRDTACAGDVEQDAAGEDAQALRLDVGEA